VPPVVTLTTDFGPHDSFVGTMKGVILSRCRETQIVDVTHEVPPQDVRIGALRIAAAAPYFPPGTVHAVVVDPGVGASRRAIAVAAHSQLFVGPDNGVLTLAAPRTASDWRAVHLTNSDLWLSKVSSTFHGRDIFAPVAGFLACGGRLERAGELIESIVELELPAVAASELEIMGMVIDVDRFGNLITNIRESELDQRTVDAVEIGSVTVTDFSQTYDASMRLVVLVNSDGWLEIAAPLASASAILGVGIGEPVRVRLRPEAASTRGDD